MEELKVRNIDGKYDAGFRAMGSNCVKRQLFLYYSNILAKPRDKQKYSEMFQVIDKDGDGVLTVSEFEEAMLTLNFAKNF